MSIPVIGGVIKGVASAFGKRQERKARESEAVAAVQRQLSSDSASITISRDQADALVRKAAVAGLKSSWKDEFMTLVVGVFFFIAPGCYAIIDAVFGTRLLAAHLQVFRVLEGIETDNAVGMVFVGVCLTAVGITGIRSFFRR